MQYKISDTSVIQITETSGTIQNVSNSVVEISNSAEFTDSFLLYPLNKMTFKEQMYARAYKATVHTITINVVPFFVEGGIADTEGSGAAVDFSQLNFLGNEEITIGSEFTNAASNINLVGGVGNDTIYNSGDNVTITGGKGSNQIFSSGANNVYIYNSDKPDTICGFTASDTLIISSANAQIVPTTTGALVSVDNSYVLLRGERIAGTTGFTIDDFNSIPAGADLNIKNAVSQFKCYGVLQGARRTSVNLTNDADYMCIKTYKGYDTITNSGDYCIIDTKKGSDSITSTGDYCIIKLDNGGGGYSSLTVDGYFPNIYSDDSSARITLGADCYGANIAFDDNITLYSAGKGHHYFKNNASSLFRIYDGHNTLINDGSVGNSSSYYYMYNYDSLNGGGSHHNYIDTAGKSNASGSYFFCYGSYGNTLITASGYSSIGYYVADGYTTQADGDYFVINGGVTCTLNGGRNCTIESSSTGGKTILIPNSGGGNVFCLGDGEGNISLGGVSSNDTLYIKDDSEFASVANRGNSGIKLQIGATTLVTVKGSPQNLTDSFASFQSYLAINSGDIVCNVKYANGNSEVLIAP